MKRVLAVFILSCNLLLATQGGSVVALLNAQSVTLPKNHHLKLQGEHCH